MLYLLDTSALIAHYRQEAGWEQVQAIFDDGSADIIVASVTLPEFAQRLRDLGAGSAEIRQTLADYKLLFSDIVAVDAAVAMAAFEIGYRTPHMTAIPAEIISQLHLAAP